MKFHTFQYPIPCSADLEELNSFLAANPIAAVSHHVSQTTGGAFLVFVVQTLSESHAAAKNRMTPPRPRIDYKEVLSESDFSVFSALRDYRKKIAEERGVPVYSIFSNAQLAAVVETRTATLEDLRKIDGIGQAKIDTYGESLLELLSRMRSSEDPTE